MKRLEKGFDVFSNDDHLIEVRTAIGYCYDPATFDAKNLLHRLRYWYAEHARGDDGAAADVIELLLRRVVRLEEILWKRVKRIDYDL